MGHSANFGKHSPRSIAYLNATTVLDVLVKITNNFTTEPDQAVLKWGLLKYVSPTDSYDKIKYAIEAMAYEIQVPLAITSLVTPSRHDLTLDQRARLTLDIIEFEDLFNPIADFVDEYELPYVTKALEALRIDHYTKPDVERLSQFLWGFYQEVGSFISVIYWVIEHKETLKKVFGTQNIRFATGALNYEKIYKLMKSQLGSDWPGYIVYSGLMLERILGAPSTFEISKPSTHVVGQALEQVIVELYKLIGYAITETSATGDYGIDVIAQSNVQKIGIQCKNHAATVGVESVMQAHSGGHYYGCTRFIVYSTNGFTSAALEMATKLNVELLVYKGSFSAV
ncbi:restriction endonuclease [Pseudomonas caspiana]